MDEPDKVVVVSYGAFSCRLEGVDDPVAVLRAIAGVFDDVTATSPWFGFPARDRAVPAALAAPWPRVTAAGAAGGDPGMEHAGSGADRRAAPPGDAGPGGPDARAPQPAAAPPCPARPVAPGPANDDAGASGHSPPSDRAAAPLSTPTSRPEAAVDRLMQRTDAALAGDDARLRHRLLGHLKAAVAATRLGDAAGVKPPGASDEMVARFRADLATAVAGQDGLVPPRPAAVARDVRGAPPGPADSPPRPAPPRADPDGFPAFAQARGAHDLPDVLAAAAAYACEVEGLDAFTRQHVMQRASALGFDPRREREAGLRAFGRLLREGRLVRAARGRFTIAGRPGTPA